MEAEQTAIVPDSLDGDRLDVALSRLSGVSRSQAKRMIETGRAGRTRADTSREDRPNTRLRSGDRLWYLVPEEATIRPYGFDLEVCYEDDRLAVINKPSGMVTHPGPGHFDQTLVSALIHRWPQVEGVGDFPRWGIVHRLDKETSGAILVALEPRAHRRLTKAMAKRQVRRRYLTITHGGFDIPTGTIDAPIDRRRARRFVGSGGRPSVTHYRRLASWERPSCTLLEVTLDTGRTHQIRVHLQAIDRPVMGDSTYGRPGPPVVDPGRVWLHAHRLGFTHPITGRDIEVSVDLPADLLAGLQALGDPDVGDRYQNHGAGD
ncbi:MAG: RluA family pseudouridine synthase [Acidimicrobiia bacterium]|nr:RluA family pseudouridine synthase [bacterium]MXX64398.1 RluA family pseudouridine synthase [Acidimicrobiia bacterium]MCY3579237.1 RluA family pseudouridine synthase [bacterium]MCY3652619.1 RluA family pseudouridine synthase [bacterium]MXZ06346.1 RluA family pseudouridine synthase [Acidimicrobiia bacterium]